MGIGALLEMPLFYLLSGFSLAITYGWSPWRGCLIAFVFPKSGGQGETDQTEKGESLRQFLTFYQNRFARICPIFYIANVQALPFLTASEQILHQKPYFGPRVF